MKRILMTASIGVLALASVVGAQGYVFNTNLTVGSTGADVVALQTWLIANGFSIPAISSGAATKGYFGTQTKAAVQAYQASRGVPNTGFVGPLTRAQLNGAPSTGGTTAACPAGYVCTPVGGTTPTTGGVSTGGITTPGVEGTISATQSNAGLSSTVYEGETMRGILGVDLEAKTSDISIQRVKLDLGTETKIYNKIFDKLYVTDGTNVLASIDLNSSTVTKDGSRYYVTIAGFNYVIPKNTKKNLTIKADLMPTIDSADLTSYTVRFAANGIRGVDGAGIDQYATDTTITRSTTVAASLADSATLKISTNSATPKKAEVIASAGSNEDELDKLTLLTFDLRAEKDSVKVTDLVIDLVKTGSGAANASSTVYIYEGSTEIDNASYSSGSATFSNFDQTIARDTTKTYTVKVDIRSANGTAANFTADVDTADVTAENSLGDSVTESGSAQGNTISVRNSGAEITLVSKSISTTGAPQTSGANNISTSTLTATFVFRVKAVGGDIMLGTVASSSPFFASTTPALGTKSLTVFRNGGDASLNATAVSFTVPSLCTTSGLTNSCTLSEGNTVDVPVTINLLGRSATAPLTSGLYSIGIAALNWSGQTTTFMNGEIDWTTSEVSFP